MTDKLVLFFLIAAIFTLAAGIARLVSFFRHFHNDMRYICYQMDGANSCKDYRFWRRELRCHYLTLIPFVNERNVASVYRFFYKESHSGQEKRKDGIVSLLMPSVFGICICLVCLCSMTWAWYKVSIQAPSQTITSAYYEVRVTSVTLVSSQVKAVDETAVDESLMDKTVTDETVTDETVIDEETVDERLADETIADEIAADEGLSGETAEIRLRGSSCELEKGKSYLIELTAYGTVTDCTGYCLIENANGTVQYYTQTFAPETTISFTLSPKETGSYTFTGVWGSLPETIKDFIKNGDVIPPEETSVIDETNLLPANPTAMDTETETGERIYTVQSGDTLSGIAEKYDVTVERLAAYNNMTEEEELLDGQEIKIPPEDWEIPEVPVIDDLPVTEDLPPEKESPVDSTPAKTPADTPSEVETEPTNLPAATEALDTSAEKLLEEKTEPSPVSADPSVRESE